MQLAASAKTVLRSFAFASLACLFASASTPTVNTFVGGLLGDGAPAANASLARPNAVAHDAKGNLYIADSDHCRIRVVSSTGTISTYAGTGICGYSGDGGPATKAEITNDFGLALDRHGNLLITDGARIRRITPAGIISTIVGNGTAGYSGDGGPALQAEINFPESVFVDLAGNIYIADTGNNVIRKVDTKNIIHTVAGDGTSGFSGDGGLATSANLNFPWTVIADNQGNFYFSDVNNERVRVVNSGGIINTFAGDGGFGNTGSGGPATSAAFGQPYSLLLQGGNLYIGTSGFIWAVNLKTDIITITAGNGQNGYNGDGNTALSTAFSASLTGLASDGSGGMFVGDSSNNRIRQIAATQIVSTAAGGNVGDNGPSARAAVNFNTEFVHMAFDSAGNLYIPDVYNNRVRKVTPQGVISTIAGTGVVGYTGDGGPATSATLFNPQAVAVDSLGNVFIADTGNLVIRKIDPSGTISTFVTLFLQNSSAESARAVGLAVDSAGNLYAADGVFAVWKITPSGATSVVAGVLFDIGYNGDGVPATQAWLNFPSGLALDKAGNLFIADWLNNRIRKVNPAGTISTVAGDGTEGFGGDGGLATSAMLNLPTDVAVDNKGNFYIADWINFRLRVVNHAGIIQTFAGSGGFGFNGNGLPANQANVFPAGVIASTTGAVYEADTSSYRVMKIR